MSNLIPLTPEEIQARVALKEGVLTVVQGISIGAINFEGRVTNAWVNYQLAAACDSHYETLLAEFNNILTDKAKTLINKKCGNDNISNDTSQAVVFGKIFELKKDIASQWYTLKNTNQAEGINVSNVKTSIDLLCKYTLNPAEGKYKGRYLQKDEHLNGKKYSRTQKLNDVLIYCDLFVLKNDNNPIPKPVSLTNGRLATYVESFSALLKEFFDYFFNNQKIKIAVAGVTNVALFSGKKNDNQSVANGASSGVRQER